MQSVCSGAHHRFLNKIAMNGKQLLARKCHAVNHRHASQCRAGHHFPDKNRRSGTDGCVNSNGHANGKRTRHPRIRALAVGFASLLLFTSLPFSALAAPTANKPFLIYGMQGSNAVQLFNPYDASDNFFIGGIPFMAQATQQGANYDAFVGVFSTSDAQTSQSGDDNFGADFIAAKPLYAFLQGRTYTRTVGSAYVQNVANDMTITGNTWNNSGDLIGTTAIGTISSPYDTMKISAGTFPSAQYVCHHHIYLWQLQCLVYNGWNGGTD